MILDAKNVNDKLRSIGKAYKVIIGNQDSLQQNFEGVRDRVELLESGADKMREEIDAAKVDIERLQIALAHVRETTGANTAPLPPRLSARFPGSISTLAYDYRLPSVSTARPSVSTNGASRNTRSDLRPLRQGTRWRRGGKCSRAR